MAEVDIVIPVYNEGRNIERVLGSLRDRVRTSFRVLICYDRDEDDTLPVLELYRRSGMDIVPVKNRGVGAFGAVTTGFAVSTAPSVLVYPADDDYNAGRIDGMVAARRAGHDIVVASRFTKGGRMVGCPLVKAVMVRTASFLLHHFGRLPACDATNGLRMFSRRILERVPLESTLGFTYSIELLAKCHRLRWPISEVPAEWHERRLGTSRFKAVKWAPAYLRWFFYVFATTYLRRGPTTVPLRPVQAGVGSDRQ